MSDGNDPRQYDGHERHRSASRPARKHTVTTKKKLDPTDAPPGTKAVPSKVKGSCKGCMYHSTDEHGPICDHGMDQHYCHPSDRADGRDVIFVKSLRGKYRDSLPSTDEFIAQKERSPVTTAPKFTPKLQSAYEKVLELKGQTLRLEVAYSEAQEAFKKVEQELVASRGREHKAFEHFCVEHAAELKRKGL